jgi:hypothetical protein
MCDGWEHGFPTAQPRTVIGLISFTGPIGHPRSRHRLRFVRLWSRELVQKTERLLFAPKGSRAYQEGTTYATK